MNERKRNGLLLVLAIVTALLVLEAGLHVSGTARMTARFTCFHPVIGKVYCASAEGTHTMGVYTRHLAINSDGVVEQECPFSKPESTLRAALPGDSFSASEYLPTEDKFEGLLERDLTG